MSIEDIDQPCFALADHARILLPDLVGFRLGVRPGSTRWHAFALAPRMSCSPSISTRKSARSNPSR